MWCRHLQCQTKNNKKDKWVFPSALHPKTTKHLQCEAHHSTSAAEVQHGSFPSCLHCEAHQLHSNPTEMLSMRTNRSRSGVEVQHGSFPLSLHCEAHQLHPSLQKMFKHPQCETHRGRSAVEVQHGSSPQAISHTPLHPAGASSKSDRIFKHLKCEAHRTGSSHTKTLLPEPHGLPHQKPHPNRPRMLRHLQREAHRSRSAVEVQAISPTQASSKRSFTQIRHKCSSSFNAKITRPAGSFSFSKPTGPYRAYTDRSSFSGPSPYLLYLHSRTFTGKIPSRERTKRNLPQTTMFTRPYAILATDRGGRVIKSPSGKEIDKEK